MRLKSRRVFGAALALGALLALAGWLDYRATAGELRSALRAEADALHATIAAAARVQHAASADAERALGQRLLENARMLALMERRGGIDGAAVDKVAGNSDVFRVVVFAPDGERLYVRGPSGQGAGPGGGSPGWAAGSGRGQGHDGRRGAGPPAGASRLAQRLLSGEAQEIVSEAHASRDGAERIAAGVRLQRGGAVVVNATNRLARELDDVYSLDALIRQIAAATPAIGYVVLQDDLGRLARGPLASAVLPAEAAGQANLPAEPASQTTTGSNNGGTELTTVAGGVPVLERRGTVALDDQRRAELRIGMRLDEVRRAEQRALLRVSGGLMAVGALLVLAVAFGSLQHRYGSLTRRHAKAEEALRRRDRLAAMGEMASTVAHEIRNPLNAIAMSAQRLAREYPVVAASADVAVEDELSELVDVIQREASRINATVQQFLEFARPRPLNLRDTPLSSLLDDIVASAAAMAGARDVRVETRLTAAPVVRVDADQLRQAVDNLVRNAIDATPAGGVVTVSAARQGSSAAIEVRDTGAGIAPDVLPRIFDLYFTTKREGTGVGLAVAQQIVAAHGGSIEAESEPRAGTRMAIRLPLDGADRG